MVRQASIIIRLWALALITVLPFLAMLAMGFGSTIGKDIEQASANSLSVARLIAMDNQKFFEDTDFIIEHLAARAEIRAMRPDSCSTLLADFVRLHREYVDAGIVDLSGRLICAASRNAGIEYPALGESQWFHQVLQEKRRVVGKPYFGQIAKKWVVVMAQPLTDAKGRMIGVLGLPIALDRFQSIGHGQLPNGAWMTILDSDATVIARSEAPEQFVGRNVKGASRVIDAVLAGTEGTGRDVGSTGVDRAYGFATIPATGWRVVVGAPIQEILAPVRDAYRRDAALVVGLTLLITIAAFAIGRGIAVPIRAIQAAAKAAALGHAQIPLAANGPREIRELADQFNRMLAVREANERSLAQSEARFRGLLEGYPDGIVVSDRFGRIQLLNRHAEKLFGWSRDEIIGQSIERLIPARFGSHPAMRAGYMAAPSFRELGPGRELFALRRDGSEFPVELMLTPLETDEGVIVSAVIRDISDRKAARAAIIEAKEFSERLIETANVVVVGLAADGMVQIFNREAEAVTGYSKAEMVGRDWFETVVPRERYARVWAQFAEFHETGQFPESFENPILDRFGQEHVISWRNTFFPPGGVLTSISFGIDVTDRRRNEEVIDSLVQNTTGRTGQEFFEVLVAWLCHWLGADASLLARLDGHGRAQVVAGRMDGEKFELTYDLDGTPCQSILQQGFLHFADGLQQAFPNDPRLTRFGLQGFLGVPVINNQGQSLGVLSVWSHGRLEMPPRAKDIMDLVAARAASELERLDAEDRVREVLDLNQKIIIETASGILAYKASGPCVLANPTAARIVGASVQALLAQDFRSIPSWRDSGLIEAALLALAESRSVRRQVHLVSTFGKESWLDCDFSVFTVSDEPHLLLVLDDITERHHFEEMTLAARTVAEEASRAKSEFLANMSHEIRTPMNAIFGLSHLALRSDPPPRQRDYLEKIHSNAYALLGVVNDVLDFSKIEAGKMEIEAVEFELKDILAAITETVSLPAEQKGLALVVSVADEVPQILVGDAMRLRQVLLNLVSNAVKFSDQGEVLVAVELDGQSGASATLRFTVQDSGIGISEDSQARLFQPFTQADGSTTRRYGGTGLGLAISKRLVTIMGGTIGVHSQPGQGSRFWFSVPLGVGERGGARSGPARPVAPALMGGRVLVVEDNEINRQVAHELLQEWGIMVTTAENGAKAVAMLQADPHMVDAVLMDVQMPVMDGLEAARLLRGDGRFNKLPIIAMTAHVFDADRRRCAEAGMDDYVAKPVNPLHLQQAVARALDRAAAASWNYEPEEGDLPGLAVASALARLGGKRDLYVRLLEALKAEWHDVVPHFAALAASGAWAELHAAAHQLKGVAGNLGVVEVADAAAAMDAAARAEDETQIPLRLEGLAQTLNQAWDSAARLAAATLAGQGDAPGAKWDPAAAEQAVSRLRRLLAANDLAAGDALDDLAGALAGDSFADDLAALRHSMDGLDFKAATRILDQVHDRLAGEASAQS